MASKAVHWRALAAEARANAASMTDSEAIAIMISIAEAYERLAARAEKRKDPQN
jgi:hypothetical protein